VTKGVRAASIKPLCWRPRRTGWRGQIKCFFRAEEIISPWEIRKRLWLWWWKEFGTRKWHEINIH